MDGLTPLERELMGYVERLTAASEASARALQDCERRWTEETEAELASLRQCVMLLSKSQAELTMSLSGWIAQRQSLEQLSPRLKWSALNATEAQKILTP